MLKRRMLKRRMLKRRILKRWIAVLALLGAAGATWASELRFCLRADPKTFHPLLVEDEASDTVRYLTGGVLIRLNRYTQELEGELATKWKVSENGRRIDFDLRPGVRFSDGTPFTCEDVVYTMRELMDPELHSPSGDAFRSAPGRGGIALHGNFGGDGALSRPGSGARGAIRSSGDLVRAFRRQRVRRARPLCSGRVQAGRVRAVAAQSQLLEARCERTARCPISTRSGSRSSRIANWSCCDSGAANSTSSTSSIRKCTTGCPRRCRTRLWTSGPSLDWEVVFFNQVESAPLPEYKRRWFRSDDFRRAISQAIRRDDIVRIVYRGHARAGSRTGFGCKPLLVESRDQTAVRLGKLQRMALLQHAGFRRAGSALLDRDGNKVEFSMITNAGNKAPRAHAGADPAGSRAVRHPTQCRNAGFPVAYRTHQPQLQLRSGSHGLHQPGSRPQRPDEHLGQLGGESPVESQRKDARDALGSRDRQADDGADTDRRTGPSAKLYFDQVQQIVADKAPMVFLVNPNALVGGLAEREERHPGRAQPADLLECRPFADRRYARQPQMTKQR